MSATVLPYAPNVLLRHCRIAVAGGCCADKRSVLLAQVANQHDEDSTRAQMRLRGAGGGHRDT